MIEMLLVFASIVIIIYVLYISKNKKNFEEVLSENFVKDKSIIKIQVKTRYFIDKIISEYKDNKENIHNINKETNVKENINLKTISNEQNNSGKILKLEKLIKDGYTDVDICNELKIGKGELILLKKLYKK